MRQVTQQKVKHTTDRHYICGEEGHRTIVFSPFVPPTPFNKSSKTYAKGTPISFPFSHPVLCSTTFSAILPHKDGGLCTDIQCSNSWLHWCHSVKSQQNTSDQGINPFRFRSLSIFRVTFIHHSRHLIMTCVVYANINWPSQDYCTNFQITHRQKVCGGDRHFLIRHLKIRKSPLRLLSEST